MFSAPTLAAAPRRWKNPALAVCACVLACAVPSFAHADTALDARCAGTTLRAAMSETAGSPIHVAMHRQHDFWRARLRNDVDDIDPLLDAAMTDAEQEVARRSEAIIAARKESTANVDWWAAQHTAFRAMVDECDHERAALEAHQ